MLEKTLESPLDCKEIQPVNPKGDQSWIFIGRNDVEAVLWPPDVKSWLNGKDPDAGKDWCQEEKGMTEDEMVGWHHQLNGHEFEQAPGVGDGQGGLACCSQWGHKEVDKTGQLNWTRFVIAFLPSCKCLLISWLHAPSTVVLEPKKIISVSASHFFPFYLPWSDGVGFHFLCSLPILPNEHYLIKIVVRNFPKGFPFFFFLSLLEELSIDWNRIILSFIFLAQAVKNLPAMQETWVRSLGWEDPLEKGMAPHSNILGWRIPWTEVPDRLQSMGLQRVRHDWAMNTQVIFFMS